MPATLFYFPVRGRGESIRLALSGAGVEWAEEMADFKAQKEDKTLYPFGQSPRFKDETLDMVQSNSILRQIGRKHGLDGKTEQEKVHVDMALEVVESIRNKYITLIYTDELAADKLAAFKETHVSKGNANGKNGGAHASYLDWLVTRGSFGVGSAFTIADAAIWDILDMLLRIIPEIATEYPALKAFHTKVAEEVPGIKAYLASDKRPAKVNGNNLG